jgi:hypothetical protein
LAGRRIVVYRATSALEHPNLAVVHDAGDQEGLSFMTVRGVRHH